MIMSRRLAYERLRNTFYTLNFQLFRTLEQILLVYTLYSYQFESFTKESEDRGSFRDILNANTGLGISMNIDSRRCRIGSQASPSLLCSLLSLLRGGNSTFVRHLCIKYHDR